MYAFRFSSKALRTVIRPLAKAQKIERTPKVLLSETIPEVELQDSELLMQEVYSGKVYFIMEQ